MPEFRPGQQFGHFLLIKKLGQGGMGEVWRAADSDGRDVALKILLDTANESGVSIEREIQALQRVGSHPCVCGLLDFGSVRDTRYLAMELLDGRDLSAALDEAGGRLPLERVRAIAADVLDGLAFLHGKRVFHRDLKPANVRLLSSGRAKLMDLGIAKLRTLTRALTMELDAASKRIGTPQYMAPEQWGGETDEEFGNVDGRTDLYAFGVMLFQMVSGEMPFRGSLKELIGQHAVGEIPSLAEAAPDAPPALDALFRRLVAKKKEDRPKDAALAKKELLEALDGAASSTIDTPPQASRVTPPPMRTVDVPPSRTIDTPAPSRTFDAPSPEPARTIGLPAPSRTVDTPPPAKSPTIDIPGPGTIDVAPPSPPALTVDLRPARPASLVVPRTVILAPRPPAAPPPATGEPAPRLQVRATVAGAEHALHVHVGLRAVLGRDRQPTAGGSWAEIPDLTLRYLPVTDPAQRAASEKTISRRHLEVAIGAAGATVTDLSSAGTSLDGARMTRGTPAPLATGARLVIGPGPLALEATVYVTEMGAPTAVLLARRGNGEQHRYLLLAAAAPIGSAPGTAIAFERSADVREVHAFLLPAPSGGLAIVPCPDAPVTVNGAAVPGGAIAPLAPGSRVALGSATLVIEAHRPESDHALR